jgi:hypothetical protein
MAPKQVARTVPARGRAGEAARVGLEEQDMSRAGYTTIALPTSLHARIAARHVPKKARSVTAFVIFWTTAGDLIDQALDKTDDPQELMAALRSIVARTKD